MGGVNFSREIYDGNNGKKTLSYLYTFLNPKPSFSKKKKTQAIKRNTVKIKNDMSTIFLQQILSGRLLLLS